jgi:sugar fermentation stimulation protein A
MIQRGYYLYVGSAMKNLTQRIERHKRLRKNRFWHIDYLREEASFVAALPVRSSERLECAIADALGNTSNRTVKGFGSSDCGCEGHLFSMEENPILRPEFIKLLQYFRIDRLEEALRGGAWRNTLTWKM